MRLRILLLAAASALILSSLPLASARGATHAVAIADFAFEPATLTITAGDTVTWTNEDAMVHTATSVDGSFDSGDLDQGESYSLTFTTPGTYAYLCTPHPTMTGRIVVVAAAPAATPAPSGLPNVALPSNEDGGRAVRALGGLLLAMAAVALTVTGWRALGSADSSRRSRRDG
jgi:amicyanin